MRSNIVIAFLIILSLQLFVGCIEEKCEPSRSETELTLLWDYHDQNGNELLDDKIREIMVYVFSEDDHLVTSFRRTQDDIGVMKSYCLHLPPGEYKIISWGNLLDKTQVTPAYPESGTPLSGLKINLAGAIADSGHYLSSDLLFHAQLPVIADGKKREYTFNFRREACYVKIVMEEFSITPQIKVKGIYGGYDLEARILPQYVQYVPDIVYDNGSSIYHAEFVTLRPANTNQLNLELYNKETGVLLYTLDLSFVLKELRIDMQNDNEVSILIRLHPLSGNRISVSVNNWNIITDININM